MKLRGDTKLLKDLDARLRAVEDALAPKLDPAPWEMHFVADKETLLPDCGVPSDNFPVTIHKGVTLTICAGQNMRGTVARTMTANLVRARMKELGLREVRG